MAAKRRKAQGATVLLASALLLSGCWDAHAATDTATLLVEVVDPDPGLVISDFTVQSARSYEWAELAVGALQYTDRPYTFHTVPAPYVGLDYLRTANDDKTSTGDPFITFRVNRAVIVYVAHDDRIAAKPSWMAGWTDTGDDLAMFDGTRDVYYSLYSKAFPTGTVSLGANGGTASECMYTVVVRRESSGPGDGGTSGRDGCSPAGGAVPTGVAAFLTYALLVLLRRRPAAV